MKLFRSLGIAVIVVAAPWPFGYVQHRYDPLDAWLSLVVAEQATVYGEDYTQAQFAHVRRGHSRTQVLEALGAPIDIQPLPEGGESLRYSMPRDLGDSYHRRMIILAANRRVVEKQASVFFD